MSELTKRYEQIQKAFDLGRENVLSNIIRCKDCKYYGQDIFDRGGYCKRIEGLDCNDDDFCAWAEDKELEPISIRELLKYAHEDENVYCQDCKYGLGHAHNVRCDRFYGMGGYDEYCSMGEKR